MRELEALRDFFASATLTAIVDLPFIFLTLGLVALIGGKVVLVPLIMVPLVIVVGLLTQPALDRLSAKSMNESMLKQSVLVETLGGLETVKATGAGRLLAGRWEKAVDPAQLRAAFRGEGGELTEPESDALQIEGRSDVPAPAVDLR